ncbi:MAG: hypothetical protein IPO95_00565 [Rhodanobacteraceae bacterium]|nr:hypothetical protein [Rhodanobacteraceae bacterium]MBL0041068.1 hypothetical protein [Xanthomonadales bacterium]
MFRIRTLAVLLAFAPVAATAADGALDPDFAQGNGVLFPSYAYIGNPVVDDTARGIAIGTDQRITVVGDFLHDAAGSDRDCGLLRLLPDGSYDTSFLQPFGYGFYTFNRGGAETDYCHALALAADHSGVFVGSATLNGSGQRSGLIQRFTPTGVPDHSFYGDGLFESHIDGLPSMGAEDAEFRQVFIDAAGRMVVSGDAAVLTFDGVATQGVVLRFLANGTLDTSFNGTGIAWLPNPPDGSALHVTASLEAPDGSYWFAAYRDIPPATRQGKLFRITAQGTFDADVGGANGLVATDCPIVQSLARDAAGRVLLGCLPIGSGRLPGVLRLVHGPGGWSPDPLFSADGLAEIRVSASDAPDLWPAVTRVAAIRVDARGRILVAGAYDPGRILDNPSDLVVVRLMPDGSKDADFGNAGVSRFHFGVGADRHFEAATAMALDGTGRPVVIGQRYSTDGGASSYVVARLQQQPDLLFRNSFENL